MQRARGFTLLEILVVMALLSVVMLALGSALRTIAQTEQRVDQRLERSDDFRVAVSFLRTTLGRISLRKVAGPVPAGAHPYYFAAAPDAVSWVGVMPPRFGMGGRYFFRLAVEGLDAGPALVLRFSPWVEAPNLPDFTRADFRVLVRDVTALRVRYEDSRPLPSVWGPQWGRTDRLPGRVALSVQTVSSTWPELIIPLRASPGSTNAGAFVIGGNAE